MLAEETVRSAKSALIALLKERGIEAAVGRGVYHDRHILTVRLFLKGDESEVMLLSVPKEFQGFEVETTMMTGPAVQRPILINQRPIAKPQGILTNQKPVRKK